MALPHAGFPSTGVQPAKMNTAAIGQAGRGLVVHSFGPCQPMPKVKPRSAKVAQRRGRHRTTPSPSTSAALPYIDHDEYLATRRRDSWGLNMRDALKLFEQLEIKYI